MKFTCEKDSLVKELSIAQEIISSKNSLSILSNVWMEVANDTLTIKATDLKVGYETKIPVQAQKEGVTTVYCERLIAFIKSLPSGSIEFDLKDDGKMFVKPVFKKIDFYLKSMSTEKYPEFQISPDVDYIEIPQADFSEMITQTSFAVSDDESRFYMNGVFTLNNDNGFVMVATDGRRLSYIHKDFGLVNKEFKGVIVPIKILHLFRKLSSNEGMVGIAVTDKSIFLQFDNQKLYSTLIEGSFPNYQRVIPEKQQYEAIVSKADFADALKRVSLMIEKSHRVLMTIENGSLILQSEESELGIAREEIACEYSGPSSKMALNNSYLSDPLRYIDGEKVSIRFTETSKAMTFHAVPENDYFHIIMPMQVND